MIKVSANKITYLIPSSWLDVTYGQWMKLQHEVTEMEGMSILSGMPIDVLERLSDKDLLSLGSIMRFINEDMNIDEYECPDKMMFGFAEIHLVKDIRKKIWGQKLVLESLLQDNLSENQEKLFEIIPEILFIYYQPEQSGKDFDPKLVAEMKDELKEQIYDMKLIPAYKIAMNYIEQVSVIKQVEKERLSSEPDSKMIKAGIDMYNQFGFMNAVDSIAKGQIWRYEEVLNIEYNTVFSKMLRNKVDKEYNENMSEIINPKK